MGEGAVGLVIEAGDGVGFGVAHDQGGAGALGAVQAEVGAIILEVGIEVQADVLICERIQALAEDVDDQICFGVVEFVFVLAGHGIDGDGGIEGYDLVERHEGLPDGRGAHMIIEDRAVAHEQGLKFID